MIPQVDATKVTPGDLGIVDCFPLPERRDWRIGLVGFGGIAGAHAPAYQSAGWQIAAVADPDPVARARAEEQCPGAHVYDNLHDLVADGQVEVVSVLTQSTVREEPVLAAIGAGKPVQTEKPLASSLEEAERMVAAAGEADVRLAVSQNRRWDAGNFMAAHIIRAGLIGEPYYAGITIFGSQDVGLADHPFYSRRADFITVQWNNHMADLLRYWTGRDARRVFARTGRMKGQNFVGDNLLLAVTDFGEGVTGHVAHSELLRSSLSDEQCRVDGDKGSLVFGLCGQELWLESDVVGGGVKELDMTGIEWPSSMCGPMGDLLISIEQNREPLVSGRRNLATIRTVIAEHRSAMVGGKWVEC